jgi:hypothetical protein
MGTEDGTAYCAAPPEERPRRKWPAWHAALAQYRAPSAGRAVWQLVATLVPYAALWALMGWTIQSGRHLALLRATPVRGRLLGAQAELGSDACRHAGQFILSAAAGFTVVFGQYRLPARASSQFPMPKIGIELADAFC